MNLYIDIGQLITIVIALGGVFSLIGYFAARFKAGKNKAQADAKDQVLRDQDLADKTTTFVISALKEKVDILEKTVQIQQLTIQGHTKEIEFLKGENKTLQELVKAALAEYFQNNPKVAVNMSKEII